MFGILNATKKASAIGPDPRNMAMRMSLKYPDILLVPVVAFDSHRNRIGYGGGFYDRYIKKIRKIKKVVTIGFAYSYQKVKKIPSDIYDIKLDFII